MSTPQRPDLEPSLEKSGRRVSDRLMDRFEETSTRVEKIPVWRIVATGRARRLKEGVRIRCVNDMGHAIDLFFKHDDWAYVRGGAA